MRPGLLFLLCLAVLSCRENRANNVEPSLHVPADLDLGFAKVGTREARVVTLESATASIVEIDSVRIEGTSAITVTSAPNGVRALGEASLKLAFAPVEEGEVSGTLVIKSNDADAPEQRVTIHGRGALPTLSAFWRCDDACSAAISANDVTFPPEPSARLRPVDVSGLPRLVLEATGDVDVLLSSLVLQGAGFQFVGNATLPEGGLHIAAGTEQSVAVVFQPADTVHLQFDGTIDVTSDATDAPSAHFAMHGSVRDNLPPTACAGVSRITAAGGAPQDVAFTTTGPLMPRTEITLTPFSTAQDTTCSFDPDDGRAGLSFAWSLTSQPAGSNVALVDATSPNPRFRPVVSGAYTVELALSDAQGHVATAGVTLQIGVQADLVTELAWATQNVDLDLHLVKPGAQPFTAQSDVSGLSLLSGHNSYDWGAPGSAGDPWMLFDSTGEAPLVEDISIEHPDCGSGACTFSLYVHEFRDLRAMSGSAQVCTLSPACSDGEACSCPSGRACVADVAPIDAGVSTSGRCLPSSSATVRIFLRGETTATASVPVVLGAPCQLVHAADVTWPAPGSDAGVVVTPASGSTRYGQRENGALQCAPPYTLQTR